MHWIDYVIHSAVDTLVRKIERFWVSHKLFDNNAHSTIGK